MVKNKLYLYIIIAGLILVCLIVMFSPVFSITSVDITGIEKLNKDYVMKTSGLDTMPNIFAFNSRKAIKLLKTNNYVDQVKIKKSFPDKVTLTITERHLSGYVEYMGSYLYIDENGRVLESVSHFTEKLPVIVGLEFSEFSIGSILNVDNQSSFDTVVTLAKLFDKYEMEAEVIRIDVSKDEDIHLYIYNIDVEFGDIRDADLKIRTIKEILSKMPNSDTARGFLDIKNINVSPRFRLLT